LRNIRVLQYDLQVKKYDTKHCNYCCIGVKLESCLLSLLRICVFIVIGGVA